MTKKRILNIRVMFVIFCGLMLGILFCYGIIKEVLNLLTASLLMLLVFSICVFFLLYSYFTKKHNEACRFRKNISFIIKISSIAFFLSFCVGMIILIVPFFRIINVIDFTTEVTVTGVVSDYVEENSTHKKFILKNCIIIDDKNIYSTDFKICVYTNTVAEINLGDKIEFFSEIEKYDYNKASDFTKLSQQIAYRTFVDASSIKYIDENISIKDTIKDATKDVLYNNLSSDNAGIAYAVLFGDKQGLSENLQDMFSYAGISHILAVSGLHIGVLVSALYIFLKKIKINKYIRFFLLFVILIFYSYLCNFTPSVCRASIMALLLCLCDLFGIEYDMLSSLSIAGIIILLLSPLSLFTISFQLSFLCIFAIISIAPSISSFLLKLKLPKFLARALAISIATNIAILPVCLNTFTQVSLIGILTNIFVLPIFSVTYVFLFVITILCLCINFLGFLLFIPNLFLHIIKVIANFTTSINFGIFKVFNVSYWALVILILTSIIIHFLMIKKFVKSGITIIFVALLISTMLSGFLPKNYSGENFAFNFKYDSNTMYYIQNGSVTMIGSNIESSQVLSELKTLRVKNIDYIIAYDFQLNNIDNLLQIINENNVKYVYLPEKFNYNSLVKKFDKIKFFKDNITLNNINLKTIEYGEQIIAVYIENSNIGDLLIPEISPTKAEAQYLMENFQTIDIIYLNNLSTNINIDSLNTKLIIINEGKDNHVISLENIEFYSLSKKLVKE